MPNTTYTVVFGPTWHECTIRVVESPEVDEKIKSMVEFWDNGKERLAVNQGDYRTTFLQQLAREINLLQLQYNWNLQGVIDAFDNREGWYKMDGTAGITIEDIDEFDLPYCEYEVMKGPTNG